MLDEVKLSNAIGCIAECVTYCPTGETFVKQFMVFLAKMIGSSVVCSAGVDYTPEMRLNWLVTALIEDVGRWPDEGLKEVRGIYCAKFPPTDGKSAWSSLPGFAAQDIESGSGAPALGPVAQPVAYLPQPGDERVDMRGMVRSGAHKLIQSGEGD